MIYYTLRVKSNGKYLKGTPHDTNYATIDSARVFTNVYDLRRFTTAFVKVKIADRRKGWNIWAQLNGMH